MIGGHWVVKYVLNFSYNRGSETGCTPVRQTIFIYSFTSGLLTLLLSFIIESEEIWTSNKPPETTTLIPHVSEFIWVEQDKKKMASV